MKNRKIISILLALTMVFATAAIMAGCGGGEDPLEVYKEAAKNMENAKDMSFDSDMNYKITYDKQDMEIKMGMKADYIKSTTDDEKDFQLKADVNMEMLGQNMDIKMYVKDKTMYMESDGTKTKQALDADAQKQVNSMLDSFKGFDISDYVKESKMEGDKLIFTVDSKKLVEAMTKKAEGSEDVGLGQIFEGLKGADIGDTTFEATVKDGNITSQKLTMPIKLDMGAATGDSSNSQKMEGEMVYDIKDIKINTGKEIEFPDFKDYK